MAGPVLSASWVTRQVSIQLDAGLEGQVKVGDPVTITLPDNQTTPGRISYVSSVASSGQNGPTIAVDAVPTDPARDRRSRPGAGQRVDHDRQRQQRARGPGRRAARAVRAGATRSRRSAPAAAHHLVPVTTGLFDDADGLVQVSGSGLAAGQRVVVPGQ